MLGCKASFVDASSGYLLIPLKDLPRITIPKGTEAASPGLVSKNFEQKRVDVSASPSPLQPRQSRIALMNDKVGQERNPYHRLR